MGRWQLQEAKQQFSRVVERARTEGPQVVTRHGRDVAVVVSVEEFRRLRSDDDAFKRFLLGPPHVDELPIERSAEPPRTIEL